jgi:hypothetical protein
VPDEYRRPRHPKRKPSDRALLRRHEKLRLKLLKIERLLLFGGGD